MSIDNEKLVSNNQNVILKLVTMIEFFSINNGLQPTMFLYKATPAFKQNETTEINCSEEVEF